MSVVLAVALIFCMVIPSYAVVGEAILVYKGITISAAAIKTLLVWSGVTIGAVAVGGTVVDNADKIAYTASNIWEDIKQSATSAAQTVKDWVTSWTDSSTDADKLEYTTPVTKTWTAEEIQTVVDAFREYLSLSTTTSEIGEKVLNIKTLSATYTITASKTYVQGDTVFTVSDGNTFTAFPIYTAALDKTVSSEAVADEGIENFISAMTAKGIQVVKLPSLTTASGTKYLDTIKLRFSQPAQWDVLTAPSSVDQGTTVATWDNVFRTTDGKNIVNVIPILYKTVSRYGTAYLKSDMLYEGNPVTLELTEGIRVDGVNSNYQHSETYIAAVPYISTQRSTTSTIADGIRVTADGYASIMLLQLTKVVQGSAYHLKWCPLSLSGSSFNQITVADGVVLKQSDISVPIDCDVTIETELGTLVNADEVQKEVPIVGIEDGVRVPADVLTGDVSITLPTTSDVTLGDTLVNDTVTAGTLTDAGIETDSLAIDTTTTADPSIPGGDLSGGVEFPTGVFDGIWKYVVHLVEKGSAFIGFLGDCLSCIPQEVSWCFYGGLVLLVFGAVLSKMLL